MCSSASTPSPAARGRSDIPGPPCLTASEALPHTRAYHSCTHARQRSEAPLQAVANSHLSAGGRASSHATRCEERPRNVDRAAVSLPARAPLIVAIANFLLAVTFAALHFTSTPAPSAEVSAPTTSLHALFSAGGALANAKYIDLTHAIHPGMDLWAGSTNQISARRSPRSSPDLRPPASPSHGLARLHRHRRPPAHRPDRHAARPASALERVRRDHLRRARLVSLRPLVVIDVTAQVAADPTYFATVADVEAHEAAHGRIPAGSAVFFRTDWSRGWEGYDGSETMPSVGLDALKLLHLERGVLVHGHEPLDTSTTPNMAEEAWLMHAQLPADRGRHQPPPAAADGLPPLDRLRQDPRRRRRLRAPHRRLPRGLGARRHRRHPPGRAAADAEFSAAARRRWRPPAHRRDAHRVLRGRERRGGLPAAGLSRV